MFSTGIVFAEMRKRAFKMATLLGVMFAVTFTIVTVETGHFCSGLKVAALAAPVKAMAAHVHGLFFAEA